MTQTITAFNALAAQHQQANELAIQAAALHNDVEAQLIQQIGIALTARDDQALHLDEPKRQHHLLQPQQLHQHNHLLLSRSFTNHDRRT